MKNTIENAKQSILLFFRGNYSSYEKLFPLSRFINMHSILMCTLGHTEINRKHKGYFSYIAPVNKDESEMIIFVKDHGGHPESITGDNATKDKISMFCVKDNIVYEYRNHNGKVWVSDFDSYTGLNMIAVAKKFHEGIIESDLHISNNELILDIVNHEKK